MLKVIAQWRIRKLTEQQFISISVCFENDLMGTSTNIIYHIKCAILAAAVIGSFSWTTIEEAYWLTHGFWHASLVLSILGILISASQITVLNTLGPLPNRQRGTQTMDSIKRYEPLLLSHTGSKFIPRRKMLFLWQCPMMFMSYSVCAFLAGLSVLVCTPLIRYKDDWTAGCNVSLEFFSSN